MMNIQERGSGWRSANELWRGIMAASGWNPNQEKDPHSTSRSHSEACRKWHILLIEDNKADVALVEEALADAQIDTTLRVLHDGQAGIDFFDAADREEMPPPDLVLLDLNLPKKSGVEVLQRLRHSTRCKDVPVVIVSSSDASRDRVSVAPWRITRYFRKASDYDAFMKLGFLVKEVLETSHPATDPV
jgi:CheY-like chemotaxis protein